MTEIPLVRPLAVLALVAAALAGGWGRPPDDSQTQQVRERLVGTWVREYQEQATIVRRVLVLESSGVFRERSIVTGEGAAAVAHEGEGDWLFDGTNLKRHYRRVDGHALSAPTIPFATFAVRFPSHNEFIGLDHIRKVQVHYLRVAEGTEP